MPTLMGGCKPIGDRRRSAFISTTCWMRWRCRFQEVVVARRSIRSCTAKLLQSQSWRRWRTIRRWCKSTVFESVVCIRIYAVNFRYSNWIETLSDIVLRKLWNSDRRFFTVFRTEAATPNPTCPPAWKADALVSVVELLGLSPWYWQVPQSTNGSRGQVDVLEAAAAWPNLWNATMFGAQWGPRTAELGSPCYNYTPNYMCSWNGPTWPYETSRVATGLANILQNYDTGVARAAQMTRADYLRLVRQYAQVTLIVFISNTLMHHFF
jgi:hypothetical protein